MHHDPTPDLTIVLAEFRLILPRFSMSVRKSLTQFPSKRRRNVLGRTFSKAMAFGEISGPTLLSPSNFRKRRQVTTTTICNRTVLKYVLSGINIVAYYAPTLFRQSLGMSRERSLFLGCFLQLWYIIACFVAASISASIFRRV